MHTLKKWYQKDFEEPQHPVLLCREHRIIDMENSALNATQCLLKKTLLLPNLISQCLLIGQKAQAEECL